MSLNLKFLIPCCFISMSSFAQLYTPFGQVNSTIVGGTNVGVGTDAPNRLFEVNATTAPTGYGGSVVGEFINSKNSVVDITSLGIAGASLSRNSVLRFNNRVTGHIWTMGQAGIGNDKFKIANNPGTDLNYNVALTILQSGFVGIGTDDPARRFVVDGGLYSGSVIGEFTNQTHSVVDIETRVSGKNSVLRFQSSSGKTWMVGNDGMDGDKFKIADHNWDQFSDGVKFTILKNGNVGIGTENPQAKLAVDGLICAKEIKCALNGNGCWPDYVFDENYALPSLAQVNAFIRANHHLPGMPAASEIESEGLALGKIQTLQMEKIEELTLYTIEQQKLIEDLSETVSFMKKELEILRASSNNAAQ